MNNASLKNEHEYNQRDGGQHGGRGEFPPGHRELSLKEGNAHGEGLLGGVGQNQEGKKEFIPGINKGQHRGGKNAGSRQGGHDMNQRLPGGASINPGGFF